MDNAVWIPLAFMVGLFVRGYMPTYVRKKAENLATKEDIGAITRKVEEVRTTLTIITDQRIKLEEARRDTLTQFFDACVTLVNERLPMKLRDISTRDDALWRHINETERLFSAMTVAGHKLALFFSPKHALLEAAMRLLHVVSGVRPVFKKYADDHDALVLLLLNDDLRKNAAKVTQNVTDDPEVYATELRDIQRRYLEQLDSARKEISEAYSRYITEVNKYVGADVLPSDTIG